MVTSLAAGNMSTKPRYDIVLSLCTFYLSSAVALCEFLLFFFWPEVNCDDFRYGEFELHIIAFHCTIVSEFLHMSLLV